MPRRYAAIKYYPIDKKLARRAKEMTSYFNYTEGSATAGSIAAGYYDLLLRCYPVSKSSAFRSKQVDSVVQILKERGRKGVNHLSLLIAELVESYGASEAVQEQAEALMKELAQYSGHEKGPQKERKTKLPER